MSTENELPQLTKVEEIKTHSNGLRGNIKDELNDGTDAFSEDSTQLIKFHGFYQQKDRDRVKDENGEFIEKEHTMMLRGRIPGGRLTPEQYLIWDELGDKFGQGALRLTTRQSIQLHYIKKGEIKQLIQEINKMDLNSMGACGDVVRNVTQTLNPEKSPLLNKIDPIANLLSEHFQFKSRSYIEIWLDGEQLNKEEEDPIYGKTYLPRKFKIGITAEGINHIDIYSNDMGFITTFHENGEIDGYYLLAGGGLGMTHNKPQTYPRVADLVGWFEAKHLISVAEAVVKTHRDFGDRTNRKHARLKYVIAENGLEWFKKELFDRTGITFIERPMKEWKSESLLGWTKATDGTYSLGIHTLSGRIKDTESKKLKTSISNFVRKYKPMIQITPDQDLLFYNILPEQKDEIESYLKQNHLFPENIPKLFHRALACPALPTCGLALTESERVFPELLSSINSILEKLNLEKNAPLIRMTGCPNGCARPYTAEIGIVGQQAGGKYTIYLGGSPEGTRIGFPAQSKLALNEIPNYLEKFFELWKKNGSNLPFGDYVFHTGLENLKSMI
jgi:sulfite reductase beta subunit-like hemoprotein